MKLMDEVAGIVAARHCNTNVVTVAVDAINFHRKIKKGERYPKQPVAVRQISGNKARRWETFLLVRGSGPYLEGHLQNTAALFHSKAENQ